MANKHYYIVSKKKCKIETNTNGKTWVIIDDANIIDENGKLIHDDSKFISNNDNKRKQTIGEILSIVSFIVVIILSLIIYIYCEISKDFNILNSSVIDNIIGIVVLLFTFFSISNVRIYLNKILGGSRFYKKTWCLTMILILPFYIALVGENLISFLSYCVIRSYLGLRNILFGNSILRCAIPIQIQARKSWHIWKLSAPLYISWPEI